MVNIARFPAQLSILSAIIIPLTFTARAQDNSLQTLDDSDGKTPVPLEKKAEPSETSEQQNWAIHFDAIEVLQGQPGFHAPYSGGNSIAPQDDFRQTSEVDLFFDFRLWPGAEFYFNPEYYQGFGFGTTHGIDQFPNAMAYKVGKYRGDINIPNLFVRQIIGLGGEQEQLEADELQLAEKVDISRLTIQVGRMALVNTFDNNSYAHNPRADFLNWAAIDEAAFDYAADSLGYEEGATIELNQKTWALRYGWFTVPVRDNVNATDGHYLKAWEQVLELEERYTLFGHPGTLRLLGYLERANLGSYRATLDNPSLDVNLYATQRYRLSEGFAVNLEQEITPDLGAFLRFGVRNPNYAAWQFTDASRSLALGLSLKGTSWKRPNDTIGLANMLAGIGHAEQAYLNAGGLDGILVGDGKLSYGLENVIEFFYNFELHKGLNVTFDYQLAVNPAFNEARGPINIFGARIDLRY
jgi:high affinity Mn2+ porin